MSKRRKAVESPAHGGTFALALGAIGIVFGDIGTSPLYTLRECLTSLHEQTGHAATRDELLGLASVLFWSIALVVSVKYLAVIMRADHHGEGGIFALLGLAPERYRPTSPSKFGWVTVLVIIGAALLYGDGAITPAISVLSAVEGLQLARPSLAPFTVQITCAILVGLFAIQSRGTATVGRLFGPVMVLWFGVLAGLGAWHVVERPEVLVGLSPTHAIAYFHAHGLRGLTILGSVVLAVTGGEALYADMGHFGRTPIRLAWLVLVWPSLVLCYLGQAAMVLAHPETAANPFFELAPHALLIPLVILSSAATVIASQALISGAYSLTRQAILLGFMPRLTVKHTSKETEGQIFMPQVNLILAVACVAIVVTFQTSSRLAAAYGLAVTGTMGITSIVFGVIAIHVLKWNRWATIALVAFFLCFDIPFFLANLTKFVEGGWLPAAIAVVMTLIMLLWARGRRLIRELMLRGAPDMATELPRIRQRCLATLPGIAVMLSPSESQMPPVLTQFLDRFKVLHERIIVLNVMPAASPFVAPSERGTIESMGEGVYHAKVFFGFMEIPDVPLALAELLGDPAIAIDEKDVSYFVRRENIIAGEGGQMGATVERLFSYLHRNATPMDRAFHLPPERVVELGWQIDL